MLNPNCLEILGDGLQVRDYCYVNDTVDALLRLGRIESDTCSAFNISSGQSHNVREVADKLISIMKLKDVHISVGESSWVGDAKHWEVSIEKIIRQCDYHPKYDLVSGLVKFVDWFNKHPERIL
jgi:nucleoside-diphosphate-sugar epimerase